MGRNLPLGFNCKLTFTFKRVFFWQLCWFAEHGYFRVRWLTTEWLGVAQRKDWVNTRLVDRLMVESIPGTSHHHFRTKLITSSITLFMLRTTNQAAIWKHLFVSICDRKDWAVIYFDAVHRCSTHKNIIIFQETKLGIFAYWAFRNPFDAVHISRISSK